MTSYQDDQTLKPEHRHHHHLHYPYQYQQRSFFDELASPLPDLCPRDQHSGSADDYFRLSDDASDGGRLCAGCMVPIRDRHYLCAVGNNWHVSCLVCCECRQPLDRQSTCYVHDARIYCRDDYFALFVRRQCGRCRQPILYSELVVQTNDLVFHNECFVCVLCNHRFTPGQQFAVAEDGNVYCPSDFQLRQHSGVPIRDVVSTRDVPATAADEGVSIATVPLCRSPVPSGADTVGSMWSEMHWRQSQTSVRSSADIFIPVTGMPSASDASGRLVDVSRSGRGTVRRRAPVSVSAAGDTAAVTPATSAVSGGGGPPAVRPVRPKRIRTTFKCHELQLMKSYFELNHNPDNNDLKQLSHKTGLSKRVLQVWFQNARAKHRRAMLKLGLPEQQQPQQQQAESHQFFDQQQQLQQQQTLAAAGGSLLQFTSTTVQHRLIADPIDDHITDYSL